MAQCGYTQLRPDQPHPWGVDGTESGATGLLANRQKHRQGLRVRLHLASSLQLNLTSVPCPECSVWSAAKAGEKVTQKSNFTNRYSRKMLLPRMLVDLSLSPSLPLSPSLSLLLFLVPPSSEPVSKLEKREQKHTRSQNLGAVAVLVLLQPMHHQQPEVGFVGYDMMHRVWKEKKEKKEVITKRDSTVT